jgi:hypothetical protein
MNKNIVAGLSLLALFAVGMPALAGDPNPDQCLECHEPAEDWTGMTVDQIMAAAKAPDNKRHEANQTLSDEELKLIIARLLPPSTP